jgi:hypothetical protein
MAGIVTEVRNTIAATNRKEGEDVWEVVLEFVLDASAGGDEIKFSLPLNGTIQKIIAKSGAATGITGTFVIAIDDNGDNEIFTSAGPAEGATSQFSVTEPVSGVIDIGVDPNDDPTGGTWTITVTLRGI